MERLFGKLGFSFLIVFLLAINVNAGGAVAGKVTILKGQVFIKRGSAKIPVKKDDTVLESDIVESEAGTARITMIDSNLVDVYPRSRVEIAKYVYKPNQDQKEVELKVDFGKIKSTVNQKYDGAKNKFQVKTPSAVAGVRGTVFTAEYDAVKKISKVVTIEGLVAVTKMIDRERQSPPVFVRPDQVVKVDVEQSKAEQPRDLKPEERESAQKQDKDLGYQYDPKKEKLPDQGSQQPPSSIDGGKGTVASGGDKEQGSDRGADRGSDRGQERKERRDDGNSGKEVVSRETAPVKEVAVKEIKEVKEVREPIKEISVAEPAKEIKEQVREQIKEIKDSVKSEPKENKEQAREQIKEIKQNLKDRVKEVREEKREQQQEARAKREQLQQQEQERRQKEAEQEQAKKQKQLEDEQAKKQKYLEEEQARRQKQIEEEQQKRQLEMEEAAKRAEAARLAAEIAKRAETVIAPITPPKTETISLPTLISPK